MSELSVILGADTSKLTKNLNDAKKILNEYANSSKGASNTISKFAGVNDAQIASFQRVVKTLEQVQSGSMATSKAEKSLANQVKELKIQWANLSETAKSSDFGKAISDSIQSAEEQLKSFRQQLKAANTEVKSVGSSSGGSSFALGDFKSVFDSIKTGDINGIRESLEKLKSVDLGSTIKGLTGIGTAAEGAGASLATSMTAALGPLAAVAAGIAAIGYSIKAASNFEVHLDSLQALTGLSNEAMKSVSDGALEMSNKYNTAATDVVDAMQLIGSQAPSLLKNSDALMSVTDAANLLSQAAGIQVTDAAKGITTAMNQMGVSAGAATDVVNMLAAASQQGSAGVEYLNVAIEKSAAQAASSGMSYSQLVSSIEGIAPLFSSADVAGSQLNSTLLSLATSSEDKFKPSVVGLNQALDNLASAEMDDAKMKDLVGASNITMLKALINNRDAIKDYQTTLVGTQTAQEQMATKNDNLETTFKSLGVQCENMFIVLGQTPIVQSLISVISDLITVVTESFNAISQACKSFDAFKEVPNTILPINTVLKTMAAVTKATGTAVEVVVRLIAKIWNWVAGIIKNAWNSAMSYITNTSWYKTLKSAWNACVKWFSDTVNKLKDLWDKFKRWLGMDVKTGAIKVSGLDGKGVTEGGVSGPSPKGTSAGTSIGSVGSGKSGSKSTSSGQPKAVAGSLSDLESKLNDLKNKYKDGLIKITPDDYKSQVQKLETEIKNKKIALGLEPTLNDSSLQAIESQLSQKNNELKLAVDQESRIKIQSEIEELTNKKNIIEFDLKFDKDKYEKLISSVEKPKDNPSSEFKTSNVNADGKTGEVLKSNNEQISKNNSELDRLAGVLSTLESEYTKLGEQIQQASKLDIDTSKEVEAYNDLGDAIAGVKDQMDNLKDANTDIVKQNKKIEKGVEKDKKQMEDLTSAGEGISSMSSAFGNLGKAIGGTEGNILSMYATMMQGIADLIPQIVKLIGAKEAESIASGTASASNAPWFMVIPQIAAVVATVTGVFASLAGSFANGGIVPAYADGGIFSGATSIGDMNLARVNSGEMILNGSQQARLFRMLNEPGGSNLHTTMSDVNFRIKGKDLVGVISNYTKKISKAK